MSLYFGRYGPISGDIGAILGDIGAISEDMEDIGVIFSSVKSFMYWARPIQVVQGHFFF